MTHIKYLVLALATATAGAAPPSLRGLKDASGAETIGDAFELPLAKAVAENDDTLAVDTMQKLRGAAEATLASRPAGRGLEPTAGPTAEPSAAPRPPATARSTPDASEPADVDEAVHLEACL